MVNGRTFQSEAATHFPIKLIRYIFTCYAIFELQDPLSNTQTDTKSTLRI